MREVFAQRWDRLAIRKKVWVVVLLILGPLVGLLILHLSLVRDLLATQDSRHRIMLAREQIKDVRRLVADIEDGFRAYLLTNDQTLLLPVAEAERRVAGVLAQATPLLDDVDEGRHALVGIGVQIQELSRSKHALLEQVRLGHEGALLEYVRSGQGLQKSSDVRMALRAVEDRLDAQVRRLQARAVTISTWAFWGLLGAATAAVLLGVAAIRQLTRSITRPLDTVRTSVMQFSQAGDQRARAPLRTIQSGDELGDLARSCEQMMGRITADLRELEALHDVGVDVATLQPDGLDAVVQRIADHAERLLGADVCLILSRNQTMACWIVEAASGEAADRLRKTVMLWEELPLSVQAFESGKVVVGERLRQDARPELMRRNLIGDSMLAVPLLSQGTPFGVMALLSERTIAKADWNVRMAESLAGAAAVAMMNARLYEATHRKEQQTRKRLHQLEQLGETLAHDLKSPAERMAGLVSLLRVELMGSMTERAQRLLDLIAQNGWALGQRVEQILALARVGGRQEALEAVDPNAVWDEILQARAAEIDAGSIRIDRERGLPPVACPRAYVYQVLDNLLSNAVKFVRGCPDPHIRIDGGRDSGRAWFRVADNGVGVPASQRERIFDPFVRLNPDGPEGTGIGLAIVRRIVELYGGTALVEPDHTPGCAVRVTLPLIAWLRDGVERHEAPAPAHYVPPDAALGVEAAVPTLPTRS
ncbi:MAG: ATP-binding protein [Nitrospiraceae bacterium]